MKTVSATYGSQNQKATSWLHIVVVLLVLLPKFFFAQLQVNNNLTAQQLVQTIIGPGYQVSNIKLNSAKFAIAGFTATGTNLGINTGIMLTTGRADTAIGPNRSVSDSYNNTLPGDVQLDSMSNVSTYDASSIEFDLIPHCDSLKIRYVFGSEEYPEFIGTNFNDIFAFFLSGPGINGVKNIATVPGTSNYVTINNINPLNNGQYYVDNTNGKYIEYDGFTKPLYAAAKVQPCMTYHLKIAIADVSDGIYDSGVFIEAGTVQCSSIMYNDKAQNTNAVEGCTPGTITFCRTGSTNTPYTVYYTTTGTATKGVDYIPLPDSVIIPAGQTCVNINIQSLSDNIAEPNETVDIVYYYTACPIPDTATIVIRDLAPVNAGPDQKFCSTDTINVGVIAMPGKSYSWLPTNGVLNPNNSKTALSLSNLSDSAASYTYSLIVTDTASGCKKLSTLNLVVNPKPTAIASLAIGCQNQIIKLNDLSIAKGETTIKSWFWDFYNQYFDTIPNPSVSYTQSGDYLVNLKVTDSNGCSDDTVTVISVNEAPKANFTTQNGCSADTILFLNQTTISSGNLTYSWDFGDGLPGCNCISAHRNYSNSNIYNITLTATSETNCSSTISKQIEIYPKPQVDFYIKSACAGTPITIQNLTSAQVWIWNFGDNTTSTLKTPTHQYPTDGTKNITLTATNKYGCTDSIKKEIVVHAIPQAAFSATNIAGCAPLCVEFKDASTCSEPNSIASWQWVTGDKNQNNIQTASTICYSTPGLKSPGLIVTTTFGCSDTVLKNNLINVYPIPESKISVDQNVISEFSPIVTITSEAIGADTLYYDLGDGKKEKNKTVFNHYYNATGSYTITQTAINNHGCISSSETIIHITPEDAIFIPNAFSPNGDNRNELFRPEISGRLKDADYRMDIFDRWGEIVFTTTDKNTGWDGRYMNSSDNTAQIDTYVYLIKLSNTSDGSEILKRIGQVTLIK